MVKKMAALINFEIDKVSCDLRKIIFECNQRGLLSSAMWASELYYSLNKSDINETVITSNNMYFEYNEEFSILFLAKSYFDNKEYDRATFFTEDCHSPEGNFLHYYSIYCSSEKKRIDNMVDAPLPVDSCRCFKDNDTELDDLKEKLDAEYGNGSLDGYCLYLYGVVLKKLKFDKQATEILCESIKKEPLHWGSWLELSSLIVDREMLNSLSLPDHWIKNFFLACTYLDLQMNELALEIYINLLDFHFPKSSYIMAQMAIAYHNVYDIDKAIGGFQILLESDPYRLDNLDIYSNLLYVREMRVALSYLAQNVCSIDKYRVETCCVVGNFYSLRTQHEKAVLYFQRALRLNPNYLSAWTLMGHEYMEMKNTSCAIQAYRQAIEVNKKDYRAWYGLGQTYEMIKMPFYCLYYYKQAHLLRPHDSRMMVALGEAYEKLEKLEEAKKCFWKAHALGDVEGMALIKLAKVYEHLHEDKLASAAFIDYTREAKAKGVNDRDELCHSFLFLARYYLKLGNLENAYENAQQCLEYPETKEGGKDILKQIANRRSATDDKSCTSFLLNVGDTSIDCSSVMDFSLTP